MVLQNILFVVLINGAGAVILVLGILVVFYFLFTYNWKRSQVKKLFSQVPFTDIDTVKDGDIVKIKGTVWDGGAKVVAPFSERTCVYYCIEVKEKVQRGKHSSWETLLEEEVMGDVVLKSGNHFAVIESHSPIAHLIMDKNYSVGLLNDATPNLEKFLNKHGYDSAGFIGFNRRMEFKEGILRRGEEFAVAGRARWISADELKFKVPVKQVLLIYETQEDPVAFSEDPSLVKNELYKGE